jgi:hypothetical protein
MNNRQRFAGQDEEKDQGWPEMVGTNRASGPDSGNVAPRGSKPTRLSVNISRNTADALQEIASGKDITMTEAVRRLIGYGIIMYRANRDGYEVLLRRDSKLEKILLVD